MSNTFRKKTKTSVRSKHYDTTEKYLIAINSLLVVYRIDQNKCFSLILKSTEGVTACLLKQKSTKCSAHCLHWRKLRLQTSGNGPQKTHSYGFYMHTVPASMCAFGDECDHLGHQHSDVSILTVEAEQLHNTYQLIFQSILLLTRGCPPSPRSHV